MWQSSCDRECPDLDQDAVGRVWTVVNRRPAGDDGLGCVRLERPFATGARVTREPGGGATLTRRIESVEPQARFTEVTLLPRARLHDAHEIETTPKGLRLRNVLALAGLWRRVFVADLARGRAQQRDALARHAAGA